MEFGIRHDGALDQLGPRYSFGDFSAGISAFQYLRSLPVNHLKIDDQLIRDVSHNQVARGMVSGIIRIGPKMGIKTIAEWVEMQPFPNS